MKTTPNPRLNIWVKVLAGWGIVQGFNVIAMAQQVVELSNSVHWLVSWWNYITKLPFDLIRWELPENTRNLLILTGIAFSAVNVAAKRDVGMNIFDMWNDVRKNEGKLAYPIISEAVRDGETELRIMIVLGLIIIIPYSLYSIFFGELQFNPLLILGSFILMGLADFSRYFYRKEGPPSFEMPENSILTKVYNIIIFVPIFLLGFFPFGVAKYRRQIAKSVGLIFLLFLLDAIFTYGFDPFAPYLLDLPEPPRPSINVSMFQ